MYEDKTYDAVLQDAMAEVTDDVQKTEGSLVFNALSPLAFEIEKLYGELDYLRQQLHADTCSLDNLILMARDIRGIERKTATHAYVSVLTNVACPIGTRFSLKGYNYALTEQLTEEADYTYIAMVEEAGSGANNLRGELTAIDYVDGLTSAEVIDLLVAGGDDESREDLYERYVASFATEAFGGNIADYKAKVSAIAGVGGCKVYPVWNGPGTVRVVVMSSAYGAISEYLRTQIQEAAIPSSGTGHGFAPIDHDVTIDSVEEVAVNITTRITYVSGYSWETIGSQILEQISAYLESIATAWPDGDETTQSAVYVSRLEAAVLNVTGVLDIANTRLNGSTANLILDTDQIPVLGEVTPS